MKVWEKIRLGNVCVTNIDSYSLKEDWEFVNYLDTGNITDNRIDTIQYIDIKCEKLPSRARRKVRENSIIYSTVRPNQRHFGIIKMQPEHFLVSTGFAVINVDENILDADFLYYILTQTMIVEKLHAIAEQSVSTYPSIKPSDIEDLEIEIPDLATQRKIAGILSHIDGKIGLNWKMNDNLEQQAVTLFENYLVENNCPMLSLSSIATIKYGKNLPTSKFKKNGYYVFGGNGVIGYNDEYIYEQPQILVSCRGAASGKVLVSLPQSFVTNNSLVFELNDYRYFEFVKHYFFSNPLYSYVTGSAQPQITIDSIKDILVPYPRFTEIEELTNELITLSKYHDQNIMENTKLAEIRDALLPKLMSGKIDVTNIDI